MWPCLAACLPPSTAPAGGHQTLPGQKSGMHLEILAEGFQVRPHPGQQGNSHLDPVCCPLAGKSEQNSGKRSGRGGVLPPFVTRALDGETAGPAVRPWANPGSATCWVTSGCSSHLPLLGFLTYKMRTTVEFTSKCCCQDSMG